MAIVRGRFGTEFLYAAVRFSLHPEHGADLIVFGVVGGDPGERTVAVAHYLVVRVAQRPRSPLIQRPRYAKQRRRVIDGGRCREEQRVHDRENHGIGPDAKRQDGQDDGRVAGSFAERAYCVADVSE